MDNIKKYFGHVLVAVFSLVLIAGCTTTQPKEIRVSHIFFRLPENHTSEQLSIAYRKMNIAYQAIKIGGVRFEEIAFKQSECPYSKKFGGDLGWLKQGQYRFLPEFENVAWTLKEKGELSKIVKSRTGLHIIKLTDMR